MLNWIKRIFSKKQASKIKPAVKNKKISEAFYLFEYNPIIESRREKSLWYGNWEIKAPEIIRGNVLDANLVFKDSWKPNSEKCYAIRCHNCGRRVYKLEGIEKTNEIILEAIKRHTEWEKKFIKEND